jgi:hypothetical protein
MMLFDVRGRGPAKRLTRYLDFDGDQGRSTICHIADKDGGLNRVVEQTFHGRWTAGSMPDSDRMRWPSRSVDRCLGMVGRLAVC